MLADVFGAIIIMSAVGAVLSVVLLLLKSVTERFFGMQWQYFMWIAVFLVMICPLKIKNDVSLPEPITQGIQAIAVKEVPAVSVFEDATGVYMSKTPSEHQNVQVDWLAFFAVVWCVVAVGLFLKTVIKNALLNKALYDESEHRGVFGKAEIRESNKVGAPFLLGMIAPVLYIPRGIWGSSQMDYVLAHEGVHLKRYDVCIKWVAALVKCIHWFNPFVYVAWRQMDETCEISCDGIATRSMNDMQKKEYMNMILEASEKESVFRNALSAGLSVKGKVVKKRFDEIRQKAKCSLLKSVCGTIVIVVLVCCTVYACGLIRGSEITVDEPTELFLVLKKNMKESEKTSEQSEKVYSETSEVIEDGIKGYERYGKVIRNVRKETYHAMPETAKKDDSVVSSVVSEKAVNVEHAQVEEQVEEPEKSSRDENNKKAVYRGEFNSEGGDTRFVSGVVADESGCVTVGIRSNTQETVDIYLSDALSGKEVHSMGVPVYYETAYVVEGLEPGKTYDIVLKGEMRNDWNIESEYIIY